MAANAPTYCSSSTDWNQMPMDEKEKAFWRNLEGTRHGAYRCLDCGSLRSMTMLPSLINGVAEVLTDSCFEGVPCYACNSLNITILFNTNNGNDALAYFSAINALEETKE
jgi:hypothetical protein